MVKSTYTINDQVPKKDTSFRSFIIALIVFCILCITIFLILFFLNSSRKNEYNENDNVDVFFNVSDSAKNEKIVLVSVPSDAETHTVSLPTSTTDNNFNAKTNEELETEIYLQQTKSSNNAITEMRSTESNAFTKLPNKEVITISSKPTEVILSEATDDVQEFSTTAYSSTNKLLETVNQTTTEANPTHKIFQISTQMADIDNNFVNISEIYSSPSTTINDDDNEMSSEFLTTTPINDMDDLTTVSDEPVSTQMIDEVFISKNSTSNNATNPTQNVNYFSTTLPTTDKNISDDLTMNSLSSSPISIDTGFTEEELYDNSTDDTFSTSTTFTEDSSLETTITSEDYMSSSPVPTSNNQSIGFFYSQYLSTGTAASNNYSITLKYTDGRTDSQTSTTNPTPFFNNKTSTVSVSRVSTIPNSFMTLKLEKHSNLCKSATCTSTASRMLSMMNHLAEPCEQFYEFACGGLDLYGDDSHDDTDALSHYLDMINVSSSKYLRETKTFYSSCVSHEEQFLYSERMENFLGSIEIQSSVTEAVADLVLTQSMPFIDIGIDIDNDSAKYILQITLSHQSGMKSGLREWSIFDKVKTMCLKDQEYNLHDSVVNLTQAYEKYQNCLKPKLVTTITDFFKEMQMYTKWKNGSFDEIFGETNLNNTLFLLDIINNLPKQSSIREIRINKEFNLMTIAEMQQKYPLLDWKLFFLVLTEHLIDDDNVVHVYFSKYFTSVLNHTATMDEKSIIHALSIFKYLNFYENTVIPIARENRKNYCMDLTKQLLPGVITNIYKMTHSSRRLADLNLKLVLLFKELKTKFEESLNNSTWLDDTSRTTLIWKLKKLKLVLTSIGDTKLLEESLEESYQNVNLTEDYQFNLMKIMKHYKNMIYSLDQSNVTEISLYRYFINAYESHPQTFYTSDMIVVPAGVFERNPPDLPDYIAKARIGFYLAKEIARHFDPVGVQFRSNLTVKPLQTINYLATNTKELIGYASPTVYNGQQIFFEIDGKLSTNERITENTAFRLALDSLKAQNNGGDLLPWISSSYSREKLFFIATAQEYCKKINIVDFMISAYESELLPPILRVQNIMSNSQAFSDLFSCPQGSAMNSHPEKLQFPHINYEYDYVTYDAFTNN